MKLLSAFPIAESKGGVVAACIKLCSGPPHTITGDTCTSDALDHHSNISAYLEVWCGCDGQLNVVRYLPTGVAMEVSKGVAGVTMEVSKGVTGVTMEVSKAITGVTMEVSKGVAGVTMEVSKGVTGVTMEVSKGVTGVTMEVSKGVIG